MAVKPFPMNMNNYLHIVHALIEGNKIRDDIKFDKN